jgi:FKBP-type peptidyl-prolyl cis-trans isomerase FkpA
MSKLIQFLLFLLLTSCSTYSDQEIQDFDSKISSYIKKNKLKFIKSSSGLYYHLKKNGEGKFILYTDSVSITYSGFLLNGKRIDFQKAPVKFAVRDLIAGWKEVLLMCKKGSEVQMILPPTIAYGNHKLDNIPQNSILKFDMKVWEVK